MKALVSNFVLNEQYIATESFLEILIFRMIIIHILHIRIRLLSKYHGNTYSLLLSFMYHEVIEIREQLQFFLLK